MQPALAKCQGIETIRIRTSEAERVRSALVMSETRSCTGLRRNERTLTGRFMPLLPLETRQTGTFYRGCALEGACEIQLLVDAVVTAMWT